MVVEKGYKQTEIGIIPEDWDMKMLGEVAKVIGGGTPSTNNKSFWNGSINWFTPTEIGSNKYVSSSNRKISEAGYNNSSATLLPQGTILLTSRAGIGDAAILLNDATTNQGFQSLLAGEKVYNEFLYYLILSKKGDLLRLASGSTFLEISPAKVKSVIIPCPSLPEQTAIANALSDMDALIDQTEKLIEKKKAIKQGVMQELLKPKDGWVTKKLPDLCWFQEGPGLRNWQFTKSGLKVINVTNLENGVLNLDRTDRHISLEEFNKMYRHFEIDEDDIVVASSGNSYGKVAIVRKKDLPLLMNTSVIRFKPLHGINYDFLHIFLKSDNFKKQIDLLITGGAQPNFGPAHLKKIYIETPPSIEMQIQIAVVIKSFDDSIYVLETKLQKLKHQKQGMMQALLTGKIRLI